MARIDVVIPCYEYGRFLRDSVGSALSQTGHDLRVLIIDNASSDNSFEIAQELAREDARVSVARHKTNLGQRASYNEGIEWASGDYFMMLDADDVVAPGSLARAAAIMDEDSNIVLTHGAEKKMSFPPGRIPNLEPGKTDGAWKVLRGLDFIQQFCARPYNFIGSTTIVRRTTAQKTVGYYHPDIKFADDLNMWLRFATLGSVAETSAVQGIRRVHQAQLSAFYRTFPANDFVEHFNSITSFFAREGAQLPRAKEMSKAVRRQIAINAFWYGVYCQENGDSQNCKSCIRLALSLEPMAVLPRLVKHCLNLRLPLQMLPQFIAAAIPGAIERYGPEREWKPIAWH
jgi:glycosyltransferase involved in cell wall biosynthesis